MDAVEVTELSGERASPMDTGLSSGHKVWAGGPFLSCCLNKDFGVKLSPVIPGVHEELGATKSQANCFFWKGSVRNCSGSMACFTCAPIIGPRSSHNPEGSWETGLDSFA